MTNVKKLIFVVCFVVLALIVPAIILLLFFDASANFSVFVVVFGIIIFSCFGYILATVKSMELKLVAALDEIKKQNAAIAYKISGSKIEFTDTVSAVPAPAPQVEKEKEEPAVDTSKVTLNPAEPLVFTANKKVIKTNPESTDEKKFDEGYDDFK